MTGPSPDLLRQHAAKYRDNHHWVPLRLRGEKGKSPEIMGDGWRKRTLKDAIPGFVDGDNIGVLLGKPSGGMVRLDPDFPAIPFVTETLFPEPSLRFGRKSSPGSGRLLICDIKSKDFKLPELMKTDPRLPRHDGKPGLIVFQILSNGKQTVVPPSRHWESNEPVVWENEAPLATLKPEELLRRAGIEAFCMAVRQFWPARGTRNEAAMALARVLLEAIPEGGDESRVERVDDLVLAVAMSGGDGEDSRDGKCRAGATLAKMRAGEEAIGLTRLVELLDLPEEATKKVTKTFSEWLGIAKTAARGDFRRAEQIKKNVEIGNDVTDPILPTIMTLAEMEDRLVFIGGSGGVVDRVTGRARKKEHAFAEYAASIHEYEEEDKKGATIVKKVQALKFWIASPQRVTVDTLAWVPGSPQICQPPEPIDGATTAFNTWRGIAPMAAPPDWESRAKDFFDHVEYLVPIPEERQRFLQWLAHIIQRPEVLPHTSYLMITRTTGIGRNLMASIIVRVLRGHVAAGISLPDLLDGGFNGRLSKKLLAVVDETREGSSERKHERGQRVKSIITEEYRQINPKYGMQSIEKNCCRWLSFSNHEDALPFDNDDRRIEVIANPTERQKPEYYEKLFGLLDDSAFIGSVRRSLETLDISSFKPGAHATSNDAKKSALRVMMSETDRAVIEFKEDCKGKAELTSRAIIKARVKDCINAEVNENHLSHAIARAGMTNTGHRIRMAIDKNYPAVTALQSIVVVGGDWTLEKIKEKSVEQLAEIVRASVPNW
ncbi:hypothetical protein SAMN05443247_06525 [Bradyrhizobium erythrophlei]|nr:hypothetical protein SAMN05443247_06525 [Bradyrhizobium erythrophlei]